MREVAGDIGDDRGLNEIAVAGFGVARASVEQAAFLLPYFNIFEDGFHGGFIDDRAHGGVFGGIADVNFRDAGF